MVLGGCGEIFGISCTSELRFNLVVEVRDSLSGAPAAWGATGIAEHQGGTRTELGPAIDSLTLHGSWGQEQAGDYNVTVRKPGHRTVLVRTEVGENACHVETRTVQVCLVPETASLAVTPIDFVPGAHVPGYTASAGVQTFGDTLVITGRAYAPCTHLTPVAYRAYDELHVQLEPVEWGAFSCPNTTRLQQFEARYHLPQGNTYLLITNAFGEPVVLFDGVVGPADQ